MIQGETPFNYHRFPSTKTRHETQRQARVRFGLILGWVGSHYARWRRALTLMTRPMRPNATTVDEPPWLRKGSGIPVIGMMPMVMPFQILNLEEITNLVIGDSVHFEFVFYNLLNCSNISQ